MKLRDQVRIWFAGLVSRAWMRRRHAKGVGITSEYPTSRWCDQVEREVINHIVYGDPRRENRRP